MNAPLSNLIGPALANVYPAYREMMDAYSALVDMGETEAAEHLFRLASTMATAFRAGAEWQRRQK